MSSGAPGLGPSYQIGEVQARRIVEWTGHLFTRDQVFADSDREEWMAERSWLEPRFWNAENDAVTLVIQSFLLESDGKLLLIDTGIGNDKQRPAVPPFHEMNTPFLERLREAGARPEEIDIVVLTHLHSDHVGWNTRLDGHAWVPTFPNARYLIARAEYDFWNPATGDNLHSPDEDQARVFADSVEPIVASDQAEFWDDSLHIDKSIQLEQIPGHTPGSAVLTVRSGDDSAMFVGDLLSTPMMIGHPDLCAKYGDRWIDDNPHQVRAARRELLARAADLGARVVPAHFNVDAGGFIARGTTGFTFTDRIPA